MDHHRRDHPSETYGLAELASEKRMTRPSMRLADGVLGESDPETAGRSGVSPWQFRLRTMLAVVAALSGLFALMQLIGAVWSAILVWFLVLVIAHVTANFWGTRVAPGAGEHHADEPSFVPPLDGPGTTSSSGAVRLRECLRPGWPMLAATALGAVIGGTLGSVALVLLSLDRAGYAGVIVGSVSAAAVGGFLGFLTSSFAEIALRAWKEAVSGANDERV